jgi:hypothetical protein
MVLTIPRHGTDLRDNAVGCPLDLVLPELKNSPALDSQRPADTFIARLVGLDLVPPESGVGTRKVLAFCATMPKAAVDEDGDLPARPRNRVYPAPSNACDNPAIPPPRGVSQGAVP